MKRRRHHWQQVVMWTCTDKQAKQAHEPGPPHRELRVSEAIGAFVSCLECGGEWNEVQGTMCPGTPASIPLAHPGGN